MTTIIESIPKETKSINEDQETFTFYSNDSADEYEYYDNTINLKNNDNNSSSMSSSSITIEDEVSYFDKPVRTLSEDTIITSIEKLSSSDEESITEDSISRFELDKEETVATSSTLTNTSDEEEELENDEQIIASTITIAEDEDYDGKINDSNSSPSLSSIVMERKLSHKISCISFSEMNDVSLTEDDDQLKQLQNDNEENYNPLKIITSALVNGEKPQISPKPVPTRLSIVSNSNRSPPAVPTKDMSYELSNPFPLDISQNDYRQSIDNESLSSAASPTKSIFTFFSSFRSSSSTNTSPASSRRPSKQNSIQSKRPSIAVAARQRSMDRPTSIISPLPGFQEALLAQMEQLNMANTNDPKSTVMKRLKRQSIRQSLITQNKGDDYDWDFWAGIMCDYQNLNNKANLIKHIRFGIPPSIRGMVWQVLAKSKNEDLVTKYMDLIRLSSPYDKMIQRDLSRTFPGHHYFKETDGQGQEGLYHVVKAYSIYDQEVGYCQGLGFIVGPILLNMPDEDAFCLLVQLMNKYGLRGHFTPDMNGLKQRLHQFDGLVEENLPHISRHLKEQGISSTMYASQWFMTLFAYKFPLNLVYRIYDVIFTEGINAIFKFALALLKKNQTTIIGLDFEQLLDYLKNGLFEEYKDDDRQFVSDACELDISTKRLTQLEKEFKAQTQKEIADAKQLENLQKSNIELEKQKKQIETKTNLLRYEYDDVSGQLRKTVNKLKSLQQEGDSLRMLLSTLQSTADNLPSKIESLTKERFNDLCCTSAELIEKNTSLDDRLQRAEAELIHMKIRYAESENEKEELHKRLFELKKLMSF